MTEPSLLVAHHGGVATLTLNRPDVGNALDVALCRGLMDAAIACDEDEAIRCVVLTGAGRMFCAGGDIGAFGAATTGVSALLKQMTAYLHVAIARFMHMEKPLITAVNGPAAGAGLGLAIAGDMVLAARSAKFAAAYGGIGLTPDAGVSWLLPRLVGLRQAQRIILLNERIGAEEAQAIGMITRVVEDDRLQAELRIATGHLLGSATRAIGRSRNLLATSFGSSLENQLDRESRAIAESGRDRESQEGVAAFRQKRTPNFAHPAPASPVKPSQ